MNIESAARSEFAGKDGFHHFWGKVVPQSAWKKEKDLKSLNIITNKKEKYYEWREYDDFPK